METDQFDAALTNFTKALNLFQMSRENNPSLYTNFVCTIMENFGLCYANVNDYADSLASYNKALELLYFENSDNDYSLNIALAKTLYGRGRVYKMEKQYDSAIADFNDARNILATLNQLGHKEFADKVADIFAERGDALHSQNENAGAISDYGDAIKIEEILLKSNRWDRAENYVANLLNRGNSYKESGKLTNALDDFNKVINFGDVYSAHEHSWEANEMEGVYIDRSSIFLGLGQLTNALKDARRALELVDCKTNFTARLNDIRCLGLIAEGMAYDKLGDMTNAIKAYVDAESGLQKSKLDNFDLTNYYWKILGNCANDYQAIQETSNAIVYSSRAIEMVKSQIAGHRSLKSDLFRLLKSRGSEFCSVGQITNAITDLEFSEGFCENGSEKENVEAMLGLLFIIDDKLDQAEFKFEVCTNLNANTKTTSFALICLSQIRTNKFTPHDREKLAGIFDKSFQH